MKELSHRKILLPLLLAFALLALLAAPKAMAAPITVNVSNGNIHVDPAGNVTEGGTPAGTLGASDTLTIQGNNPAAIITVNGFDAKIVFDNLTAQRMEITGNASVTIQLTGTNTLDASTVSSNPGIQVETGNEVTLTSATGGSLAAMGGYYGAGIGGGYGGGGTVNISGSAQVTATGGYGGAGIGGGYTGSGGTVHINGDAQVTATSSNGGAGIGGGYGGSGGTVNIDGDAQVTATGGNRGAGIGGGDGGDGGMVNVFGNGQVIATGGKGGAGIGGGDSGDGGTVNINGQAIVHAQGGGGNGGAGIGGGISSNGINGAGGTVNISGNTHVTAIGGTGSQGGGAGIGGGNAGPGANVTISGGTVIATGGRNSAGIGGGSGWNSGSLNAGDGGHFTMTGGQVTATGQDEAAGIGGGGANGSAGAGASATGSITGGTVYAYAGSGNPGNDIGSGLGGNDTNQITITPPALVYAVGNGIQGHVPPPPPQPPTPTPTPKPAAKPETLPSTGDAPAKAAERKGYLAPIPVGYNLSAAPAIQNVKAEALEGRKIKLSVEAASTDGSRLLYQWQVQSEDGAWKNVGGANGSVYTATKLKADKEYSFRCVVKGYGGASSTSDTVKATAVK